MCTVWYVVGCDKDFQSCIPNIVYRPPSSSPLNKGGVYSHTNTSQKMLGGHAVKIVGWGVQNASTVNGTTLPEQE